MDIQLYTFCMCVQVFFNSVTSKQVACSKKHKLGYYIVYTFDVCVKVMQTVPTVLLSNFVFP